MAISFDAATVATSVVSTTLTYAHTCTGSDRIIFVAVQGIISTDTITGVTYNGVALTLVNKIQLPSWRFIYLWYLIAPATGANNVVVTSSSSGNIDSCCSSYTGVGQSGQPDNNATNNASAVTTITTTLTTIADNCWSVLAEANDVGGSTAGSGTTLRGSSTNGIAIFDSNAAKTPAGSVSLIANIGGSGKMGTVMASFSPPSVANTTNFFAMMS